MDRKTQRIIGLCVAVGTAIVVFAAGLLFDLFPGNPYSGVFWMVFMPLVVYYSAERPEKKHLIAILVSYACGLAWGTVCGMLTPTLKSLGELPFAMVCYLLMMFLIPLVHKGLLGHTVFGKLPCVFLGFAETIACGTTMFPASGAMQEFLPPASWSFVDLFLIFVIGCAVCLATDLLSGAIIGQVMKRRSAPPAGQSSHP